MAGDVVLLLRRAGFGPTRAELTMASTVGYAATLANLVAPSTEDIGARSAPYPPIGLDPHAGMVNSTPEQRAAADRVRAAQGDRIKLWWLDRMTVADHQAKEKLVFFWHGHWATSLEKVGSPQLMMAQHRTLREATDFAVMVRRMVVDGALIFWLDGHLNTRQAPNENLARELFELFTLGIGTYSEGDVKEAARALTGWRVDLTASKSYLDTQLRDGGTKTILGSTARFTAASLADLVLGRKECPRFLASRLWFRYASVTAPLPAGLQEKMVAEFPRPMSMLRVLFDSDAFRATRGTMVKQPVEWLIGAMRQLGVRTGNQPREVQLGILTGLEQLGQVLFYPPSVGGWAAGPRWLTSAAAQAKLSLANELTKLVVVDGLNPEELAHVFCIERWTDRTYAVLRTVKDPRVLLTLGLVSPEYLVT